MTPAEKSKESVDMSCREQILDVDVEVFPSKEEILNGIRDGYVDDMSGGKGQPIDDIHREIAEELARVEQAHNPDYFHKNLHHLTARLNI